MRRGLLSLFMIVCFTTLLPSCSSSSSSKANSKIVGKWNTEEIKNDGDFEYESGPFSMIWTTKPGKEDTAITIDFGGLKLPITVTEIPKQLEGPISEILSKILKDVSFEKNGNIIATYSDLKIEDDVIAAPQWKTSSPKLASYKVKSETELLLILHIEEIIKEATKAKDWKDDIQSLLKEGIPVKYSLDEKNNKLKCYLDKSNMLTFLNIVLQLEELLTEDVLGELAPFIKPVLEQLPGVLDNTDQLEVGLIFKKG